MTKNGDYVSVPNVYEIYYQKKKELKNFKILKNYKKRKKKKNEQKFLFDSNNSNSDQLLIRF